MKVNEMRELTVDELLTQLQDTQKSLFEARFKHSMHQLESPAVIRTMRHQLAQLKTVLNEKGRK